MKTLYRLKQKVYLRHFYLGWVMNLLAGLLIIIIDTILFVPRYLEGMPAYANTSWNLLFRFPVWFFLTCIGTILLVFFLHEKLTPVQKIILILINYAIVAVIYLVLIFFFAGFLTNQIVVFLIDSIILITFIAVSKFLWR